MPERIEPINVIEREWHTIVGHEDLGEFAFAGSPALAKCDEIAAETGSRPRYEYHCIHRPTEDVIRDLNVRLKQAAEAGNLDAYDRIESGFSHWYDAVAHWPKRGWIAVYVVAGGSEGWYIHVDAIMQSQKNGQPIRSMLALAKFLTTQDDALAVANLTTKLLGA